MTFYIDIASSHGIVTTVRDKHSSLGERPMGSGLIQNSKLKRLGVVKNLSYSILVLV